MDSTKVAYLRKFIKDSKNLINVHDVEAISSLNEQLQVISTLDFASMFNNKLEINHFFSSLWHLMSIHNEFHGSGLSILTNVVKDHNCKQLLIHTFRYVPILTEILMRSDITSKDTIKVLNLIEDLTLGLKISYQEPFLLKLIEKLHNWIMRNEKEGDISELCQISLSVLTNICDGNAFVINLIIEHINMTEFFKHMINREVNGCDSIQICRLLLNFNTSQHLSSSDDIHRYLTIALQLLLQGIRNMNKRLLTHIDILLRDICSNSITKSHVFTYEHFESSLQETVKHIPFLFAISNEECKHCLQTTFNILITLIDLELFTLRGCHKAIVDICIRANSLPDLIGYSYRLLAAIVSQYEEDGMLSDHVASSIAIGLQGLLNPIKLDVKTNGVDWLRFLCALNDCHAMRDSILHNMNVEKFEDSIKQILHSGVKNNEQEVIIIACHICLPFIKRNTIWDSCFHHILSESLTQKILSNCLSNISTLQKKYFVGILRHPDFPVNRINEVFFHKDSSLDQNLSGESFNNGDISIVQNGNVFYKDNVISKSQEKKIDNIIFKIENALQNNEIQNVSMFNLIELYKYKMLNMEHVSNILQDSLKVANQNVTQLNHSIAMLQATNKSQENILFTTEHNNEKLQKSIIKLSEQMNDAEKTIKIYQSKLAEAKLKKSHEISNIQSEYEKKILILEKQINESTELLRKNQDELIEIRNEKCELEEKLTSEVKKNSELGIVLCKFESKVKLKEKKLAEVMQNENSMKNELERSQQTIEMLEKTLLEREKRLSQVTSQLEEMQKVQELIANLMNKGSTNVSSSSMNN